MKKSLFFYMFALLCVVNLFTSCSKDKSIEIPIDSDLGR